jgi:hypothetical protein
MSIPLVVTWENGRGISQSVPFITCSVYPCVHPVPSYYGRVGHIPVYHMYACILMSMPSHCTKGEWDIYQSVPFTTCTLCPSRPIILWESETYPGLSHLPHVCMSIILWESGTYPQSVPFTTYMCVSLCPSRPIVLWESGTYPSLSHLPHIRVYPCVHPVPSYYGRVGPIPVCPIYHMYACILMSIPSHCTMGEWDISQSVPFTTWHLQLPHVFASNMNRALGMRVLN